MQFIRSEPDGDVACPHSPACFADTFSKFYRLNLMELCWMSSDDVSLTNDRQMSVLYIAHWSRLTQFMFVDDEFSLVEHKFNADIG